MFANADKLRMNVFPFVAPPKRVSIETAARKNLKLKGGGGFTSWSPDKTPYLIEPMNLLNSRDYHTVAFKGPARTGKTAALILAPIIHSILYEPADIMMIHMGQTPAENFSKGELEPVLKADKEVKNALSPISRDNNVTFKKFKAGNLLEIAWPVDSTFRGKSRRYVMITDYDAVPNPPEGDVYTLSRKRTASYQSLGTTLAESSPGFPCSDPDYKEKDEHESAPAEGIATIYMSGDRRRWYWQCPECGEWFIPEFERLVFDRDEVDPVKAAQGVFMACPHNGCCLYEEQKNELNKGGKWLKQGQTIDSDGVITGEGIKSKVASFWLPGPAAAFARWDENFVQGYISAKNAFLLTGDDSKLQAFFNVDCGRVYIPEPTEDNIEVEGQLEANKCSLPLGMAPDSTKALFASVDVQGGKFRRFVVQIHALSDNRIQNVIDRFNITHITENGIEVEVRPDVHAHHWKALIDKVLDRQWETQDGRLLKPVMMAYDTNGEPGVYDRAIEFYRNNKAYQKRLMPVKGGSSKQEKLVEISKPKSKEVKFKTRIKRKNGDVPLYMLNTNKLKDIVIANVQLNAGEPKSYIYSHELNDSFYTELLAENRDSAGRWTKPAHRANESFDLCCYVQAIMVNLKLDHLMVFGDKFAKYETKPVTKQKVSGFKKRESVQI